jgi:flavin reductase (DIM6/NTAB) family NADH-FMN oxidoreductase RutF
LPPQSSEGITSSRTQNDDFSYPHRRLPPAEAPYVPRAAADTVLHGVVQEHLESFLAAAAARTAGVGLPRFSALVSGLLGSIESHMIDATLQPYRYIWPTEDPRESPSWHPVAGRPFRVRDMPESRDELAADSRWPSFFPSPICLVTTTDGRDTALEKVVGASIVNRFPYVIALSFCKEPLSSRHHVRAVFSEMLERGGTVAVQYLPPGELLDRAMQTIATVPEDQSNTRLARTGLPVRRAVTNACPVFADAYMVYEAKLVQPGKDFEGQPIYETAWVDVGSHRVYFLEITAIQLRQDIAEGRSQIHWRSLPAWTPRNQLGAATGTGDQVGGGGRYIKGYTPNYAFPSGGTIAFEADSIQDGMAIKHLPPLPEDQVEVDNDRARWPCFFPSSAGLITSWSDDHRPNLMPCGSTTILSRHPLVIAPCVSYAAINERYAPRASLDILRKRGRFGCGVPYIHEQIVSAMKYAGTTSISLDPDKVANAGLEVLPEDWAPVIAGVPLHYDCEIVGEVRLGTHIMFLGEVRRIWLRDDVSSDNPLEWYPWASVVPTPD